MNFSKTLNLLLLIAIVSGIIACNSKNDNKQEPIKEKKAPVDYTHIPKKNIKAHSALYPTPTTVVGTKVNGKINWIAIAHIGNIGFNKLMISMHKSHFSNAGIKKNKTLSVNMLAESQIIPADFVGIESGKNVDKSKVFDFFNGTLENAPMIKSSPITMECKVVDIYNTEHHDNFIVQVVNTYVSETVLTKKNKIDFSKVKPLLFEMSTHGYYKVGDRVGNAWGEGKKYKK